MDKSREYKDHAAEALTSPSDSPTRSWLCSTSPSAGSILPQKCGRRICRATAPAAQRGRPGCRSARSARSARACPGASSGSRVRAEREEALRTGRGEVDLAHEDRRLRGLAPPVGCVAARVRRVRDRQRGRRAERVELLQEQRARSRGTARSSRSTASCVCAPKSSFSAISGVAHPVTCMREVELASSPSRRSSTGRRARTSCRRGRSGAGRRRSSPRPPRASRPGRRCRRRRRAPSPASAMIGASCPA